MRPTIASASLSPPLVNPSSCRGKSRLESGGADRTLRRSGDRKNGRCPTDRAAAFGKLEAGRRDERPEKPRQGKGRRLRHAVRNSRRLAGRRRADRSLPNHLIAAAENSRTVRRQEIG